MTSRILLLLGLAVAPLLASCSSMPRVEVPKEVKVQVPVACVEPAKRPQRPELSRDDDLLAMDRGTRTLRAWSDRERMQGYIGELEAVVEGCSRIPPAGKPP